MTIQPLLELLTDIYDSQAKLLELAKHKQEVIVQDHTDELSRIMQQESKLIKRLTDLDAERSTFLQRYLSEAGVNRNLGITLTEFSRLVVQAREKFALLELQTRLLDVTRQLKAQNDTNQQLIRNSLEFIDFSLELLTGAETDDMTYQNPAQSKSAYKNKRVFDTRA